MGKLAVWWNVRTVLPYVILSVAKNLKKVKRVWCSTYV